MWHWREKQLEQLCYELVHVGSQLVVLTCLNTLKQIMTARSFWPKQEQYRSSTLLLVA